MVWGITEIGEIKIQTSGSLTGSPYPHRRKFFIDISADGGYFVVSKEARPLDAAVSVLNDLKELLELAIPKGMPSFNEYVASFCKFCRVSSDGVNYCFRHQTVLDMPIGNVSNLDYAYNFEIFHVEKGYHIVKLHFEIGLGWQVDGAIIVDKCYEKPISGAIRVKRPSGKMFTYKLHNGPSSAAYILQQVVDFINNIIDCITDANSHDFCKYWYVYPKIYV